MEVRYRKMARIALVLVYLVIIAGAVVRMTGSGMGCPDWPKCFGYYIPPTSESQIEWQPEHSYKKGQVIIISETLQVAKADFITDTGYNPTNWEAYTKHDYAVFNAFHTWTEFINRLFGALAGLGTLILAIVAIPYWKKNKTIPILSFIVVIAMGIQGWLGATVVYSVLEPIKITIHMLMALFIVALLVLLIHKTSVYTKQHIADKLTTYLIGITLLLTLIQIVLGTQVRQFVDEQIELLGPLSKQAWLAAPELSFYVHRTLSLLVLGLNAYLAFHIFKFKLGYSKINWVLGIILLEIITGLSMYYADFPFASQPLHLVFAAFLFGIQCYLLLESRKALRITKTL